MSAEAAIRRLTGIYNAEGSLRGELRYLVGKLTGTAHCALCDITHAGVREKTDFRACRRGLPVPFDRLHLDELDPRLRAFVAGRAPCVVGHTDGELVMILEDDDLGTCHGDVDAFRELLDQRLGDRGLRLEPA